MSDAFDPVEFKTKMRTEWRSAAAGWRKWHDVVEAAEGGQVHSATLVELAGIGPGDIVLDVAGGYGEPKPLIDQLREAERTIGRREAERDQVAHERDTLRAELAAAQTAQEMPQERAAGALRRDQLARVPCPRRPGTRLLGRS